MKRLTLHRFIAINAITKTTMFFDFATENTEKNEFFLEIVNGIHRFIACVH